MEWDISSSADPREAVSRVRTTIYLRPSPAGFLPRLRLRTRFLLSMLLITAGLTTISSFWSNAVFKPTSGKASP